MFISINTNSHADGMSTDTIGLSVFFKLSITVSNGGLGSPLNENPNIASKTTSLEFKP